MGKVRVEISVDDEVLYVFEADYTESADSDVVADSIRNTIIDVHADDVDLLDMEGDGEERGGAGYDSDFGE